MTARDGTPMYAATATLEPAAPAAGPPGVVVEGQQVPGWVARWCRDSGRALAVLPVSPGHRRPAAAAAACAAGASLLVPRPLLEPGAAPQVVAAVCDLPDDELVLTEAAAAAARLNAGLLVVHGVPWSFGERSVGLDAALEYGDRVLTHARDVVAEIGPGLPVVTALRRIWPHELVGENVEATLLAVGGARAGAGARLGLVTLSALHHAPCPVLLVPRPAAVRADGRRR